MMDSDLIAKDAMHDFCWCQDPQDALVRAEEWDVARGHDSFFVKGQQGDEHQGLGVFNNEYIVFHPHQVLPMYKIDYVLY